MSRKTLESMIAELAQRWDIPAAYQEFVNNRSHEQYDRQQLVDLGLPGSGETLRFKHREFLDAEQFLDDRDLPVETLRQYWPVAFVDQASEFYAIEVAASESPVYLWDHETGEFSKKFDSFPQFLSELKTKKEVSEIKAKERARFSAISKQCQEWFPKAKKAYRHKDYQTGLALIGKALEGRNPVPFDGYNHSSQIGRLGESYLLQAKLLLASGDLDGAVGAFTNARVCAAKVYFEALLGTLLTACLLGRLHDTELTPRQMMSLDSVGHGREEGHGADPAAMMALYEVEQLATIRANAEEGLADEQAKPAARHIVRWFVEGSGG